MLLRIVLRGIQRRPLPFVAAVAATTVGIGITAAILAVLALLFHGPLPYPSGDQLVLLESFNPEWGGYVTFFPLAELEDWNEKSNALLRVEGFATRSDLVADEEGNPERVGLVWATPGLFQLLGLRPVHGRGFVPEDQAPGAPPVAVVSHRLWKSRLGGVSDAVGQTILLNDERVRVVGVMPEGFHFPERADLWVPVLASPPRMNRNLRLMQFVGRRNPKASLDAVQSEVDAIAASLAQSYPDSNEGWQARAVSWRDHVLDPVRPFLTVLFGIAGVVLVVVVVNVAHLLVAQAVQRRQERAMQVVLGASGSRVLGQEVLMVMATILIGGSLGAGVAIIVARALLTLSPVNLPAHLNEAEPFFVWIAAAAVLASLLGLLGVVPLVTAQSRLRDPGRTIREENPVASGGPGAARMRRLLMAGQVCLSVVLLVLVGLMGQSLLRILRLYPGFESQDILTFSVSPPTSRYSDEQRQRLILEDLLGQIESLPGVESAGVITGFPLGGRYLEGFAAVGGETPDQEDLPVDFRLASADYFRTLEIPLRGRGFADRAGKGGAPEVIVNRALARALWPAGDPIGQRIALMTHEELHGHIVGVIDDLRQMDLTEEPRPEVYLSMSQFPPPRAQIVIHAPGAIDALGPAVRDIVHQLDPLLLVEKMRPLREVLAESLQERRFLMLSLGALAGVALLLASFGIYGLYAFLTAVRARELGIRMALGASRRDIRKLVTRAALKDALLGLLTGLALAYVFARLLAGYLYRVTPTDAGPYAVAALVVLLAVLLAVAPSAVRAAQREPISGLVER